MMHPTEFVDERPMPYPTATDFFKTFNEDMDSLYLLSFLLTADSEKAEQCLVSAMGECVEGVGVLKDWARSLTRGAVIKHAIRMIQPAPDTADHVPFFSLKRAPTPAETHPFAAILLLDTFERFVFVMAILEG